MDCYRHGGTVGSTTCVGCQRPICAECAEEVAGHAMCPPCVADAQARLTQPQPAPWLAHDAPAAGGPVSATAATIEAPVDTASAPAAGEWSGAPSAAGTPPGIMRRLGRGWMWGIWYAQWWTLMTVASSLLWGHGLPGVANILVMAFVYGFFGSLAGLIIGASNASFSTGTAIGIGTGIVLCLLEALLAKDTGAMLNLLFYFFTGRFVGAGITWRVRQPVR